MTELRESHFKDVPPEHTVARISQILESNGILVSEAWQPTNCVNTHAMRLTLQGTNIGANGKGVDRRYARASAYAELFERLQNNFLQYEQVDGVALGFDFHVAADEVVLPESQVLSIENAFMDLYWASQGLSSANTRTRADHLRRTHRKDYLLYQETSGFVCFPFESQRTGGVTYLPYHVFRHFYGSNGMCAGNTRDEALVQGFSEIIERHVQRTLLHHAQPLSDIPDDYLRAFPEIWDRYSRLRENPEYHCVFKDCTLGGRYPVAGLLILHRNTGQYGLKLGCHPHFGIALERAVTEAAQGQDIFAYSQRSHLDFSNLHVTERDNVYNVYKTGQGQQPFELLESPTGEATFIPPADVSDLTNGELLERLVADFLEDGYDVLIRDVSFTGFPSFQIIVPGISELCVPDGRRFRAYNTRSVAAQFLAHPETITPQGVLHLRGAVQYFQRSFGENTIDSFTLGVDHRSSPLSRFGPRVQCDFLLMLCSLYCEEWAEAARLLAGRLPLLRSRLGESHPVTVTALALHHVLGSRAAGVDPETARALLTTAFDTRFVDRALRLVDQPHEVFTHFFGDTFRIGRGDRTRYREAITQLYHLEDASPLRRPHTSEEAVS